MSAKLAGKLFTQRRFAPLFTLLQTGTFNDNTLKNALIWLITFGGVAFLSNLNSTIRVPVAAFIFTGPFLLVCAIAGQIADKYDRSKILKNVKRAEMVIMIIAAIGFWTVNVWILAFALFCMGAQSAFFSPTKNAVLPQWLEDDELITGNALLNGFVFVFILVGMVASMFILQMMDTAAGTKTIACIILAVALTGLIASQFLPPAPAPKPALKINFNPITATYNVLKQALVSPEVLRPMLGIAWFYGASTVSVTILPDYIAEVLGYNANVLIVILIISTISILIGSLLCTVLAKGDRFGKESVGLSAIGIVGVMVFALDFYLSAPQTNLALAGGSKLTLGEFWMAPGSYRLVADFAFTSLFGGMFVVPLQAMAQRRANPAIRARLMSAGAVLLNLFVNAVTIALIYMGYKAMPPKTPFLMVAIGSFFVAAYCIYRTFYPSDYPSYVGVDSEVGIAEEFD